MTIRHNLYFDREIARSLDAITRREGGNKSKLVNDALHEWLQSRGTRHVEAHLKTRLDRLSREQHRGSREIAKCRRDVGFVLEALMLFVRYELTVNASLPEADETALRTGGERYERFIAQLGRIVKAGGTRLASNDDEAGEGETVP